MKPTTSTKLSAAVLLSAALCGHTEAQSNTSDWYTTAGGSGTSTNSQYAITGTIGQPATSALVGGTYSVQSGFWGLVAAIQTPGAPAFRILNTGTNTVAVVWPTTQTRFTLQENTDLNTTNWVSVNAAPTNDGTNNTVIIPYTPGNRFFRLKWP